jgi:hypothetical protein
MDVNGDTIKDVIITHHVTAAGGNAENITLLHYNLSLSLVHYPDFDIPNMMYDPASGLIFASWWGGATSCQQKWSYRVKDYKLDFDRGIMFCPDANEPQGPASLTYFKIINDKYETIKVIDGEWDRLWHTFESAIWNSEEDY